MISVGSATEDGTMPPTGRRPRLLDLFCGAGGASMGYHRAGWEVVGVDLNPKAGRDYPFEFVLSDALYYLAAHWREFDAFHASPPCQSHTRAQHLRTAQGRKVKALGVDLVAETRAALIATQKPWVIENVPGAPLVDPLLLCGSMFPDLHVDDDTGRRWLQRHRLFESSEWLLPPSPCRHKTAGVRPLGVYHVLRDNVPHGGQTARTLDEAQRLMGIDWMRWEQLKESIPPAYTEHLGEQLLAALDPALTLIREPA